MNVLYLGLLRSFSYHTLPCITAATLLFVSSRLVLLPLGLLWLQFNLSNLHNLHSMHYLVQSRQLILLAKGRRPCILSSELSHSKRILKKRNMSSTSGSSALPKSSIPIFETVDSFRQWRQKAFDEKKSVGFVPTMGALHEGHLSLVRRSLAENDLTVVSIFVNPAQFAPHEDLTTYPRTLARDLTLLEAESFPSEDNASNHQQKQTPQHRTPSAVFLPTVGEMYPSGIVQDVSQQRGAFVEVAGFGHQMEGRTRPTFFRGVATVVSKLFNVILPTHAYFGQKDIQQALLLRRLCRDMLMAYPTPENLHIVPTARNSADSLALSSRNAYLTEQEREFAGTLYAALDIARQAWSSASNGDGGKKPKAQVVQRAVEYIEVQREKARAAGVEMKLDYVEMNDWGTFEVLEDDVTAQDLVAGADAASPAGDANVGASEPVLLSGAVWVGKTRIIDNLIVGDESKIVN